MVQVRLRHLIVQMFDRFFVYYRAKRRTRSQSAFIGEREYDRLQDRDLEDVRSQLLGSGSETGMRNRSGQSLRNPL